MALDVFMQGYSFVRRNFFGIWGFVYSVPYFFMDELGRREQEEDLSFSGDRLIVRLFSLFLYQCFLCQFLLFSVSSTKGCSLTSELEWWEWSRILATLCT